MPTEKICPPTPSKGDMAHSIAKAGLSAIPVIGGAATELFQNIIQPPLEKRRTAWMNEIGNKLHELERQGLQGPGCRGRTKPTSRNYSINWAIGPYLQP